MRSILSLILLFAGFFLNAQDNPMLEVTRGTQAIAVSANRVHTLFPTTAGTSLLLYDNGTRDAVTESYASVLAASCGNFIEVHPTGDNHRHQPHRKSQRSAVTSAVVMLAAIKRLKKKINQNWL